MQAANPRLLIIINGMQLMDLAMQNMDKAERSKLSANVKQLAMVPPVKLAYFIDMMPGEVSGIWKHQCHWLQRL